MSKALTPLNQNNDRKLGLVPERSIACAWNARFASYFGNFGIFNPFLMLWVEAHPSMRRSGRKREFPLITAFVAIV
jgi:hypothetical protein